MKTTRIYRILRLIVMLQSRRHYAADELAGLLSVSRRTVFRDLNVLEQAHVPYHFDPDSGGYRIEHDFFPPPINLTVSEALSLLTLTGRVKSSTPVQLARGAMQAGQKVESVLPRRILDYVGHTLSRLEVTPAPAADHEGFDDIFDALTQAIVGQHICELQYDSLFDKKVIDVAVHPLRLVFRQRAWYLLAWSQEHGEIRTFKVLRIRQLGVRKERFVEPTDVTTDEYFGDAWNMIPEGETYEVHLHFSARVARNVSEVQWHANQEVTFRDDGSCDFRVRVDGYHEISWWILGYGDQVEVLAPQPLREKLSQIASNMHAMYQRDAKEVK
jgi:predicted DNA-binding transcriptional regulator YafY